MKNFRQAGLIGQELIEYAITLPLFLLLILGILDMGRVTYYYSAVYNAAREGARYAAIHPDDTSGIRGTVLYITAAMDPSLIGVTIIPHNHDDEPDTVEVTVTYEFYPVTPFIAELLSLDKNEYILLGSRSTMVLEQ